MQGSNVQLFFPSRYVRNCSNKYAFFCKLVKISIVIQNRTY